MAKVHIKSEKLTPFSGIFSIMEHFDALLSETINSTLGWVGVTNGSGISTAKSSVPCCTYFLWRFLRRKCEHPPHVTPLTPSAPSHMKSRHHSQSHKGTFTGSLLTGSLFTSKGLHSACW